MKLLSFSKYALAFSEDAYEIMYVVNYAFEHHQTASTVIAL